MQRTQRQDDLDESLRQYSGLEGLARKIGQGDPLAYRFEEAANDDESPTLSARVWAWLCRIVAKAVLIISNFIHGPVTRPESVQFGTVSRSQIVSDCIRPKAISVRLGG